MCILPSSCSRWRYVTGHKFGYKFSFFASTLVSLCGMFDAILFFLTRPALVIGTPNSPPLALAPVTDNQTKLTITCSPTGTASDHVSPDVERDYHSPGRQFQPSGSNPMPHTEGSRRTPPWGGRESDLGLRDLGGHTREMTGERSFEDFGPIPFPLITSPLVDEDYGHLPV